MAFRRFWVKKLLFQEVSQKRSCPKRVLPLSYHSTSIYTHPSQQHRPQVVDLTELILANRGPLADPLIAAAGTDITHWFSPAPIASVADGGSKSKSRQAGSDGGGGAPKGRGRSGRTGNSSDLLTGDPRTCVDPQTGLTVPYLPMGRYDYDSSETFYKSISHIGHVTYYGEP